MESPFQAEFMLGQSFADPTEKMPQDDDQLSFHFPTLPACETVATSEVKAPEANMGMKYVGDHVPFSPVPPLDDIFSNDSLWKSLGLDGTLGHSDTALAPEFLWNSETFGLTGLIPPNQQTPGGSNALDEESTRYAFMRIKINNH